MRRGLTLGAVAALVVGVAVAVAAASASTVRSLRLGGTFIVTGQTGGDPGKSRAVGTVFVRQSWDGKTFSLLERTRTDSLGRYRVSITPQHRGLLRLRIVPPDKHLVPYVLQVR
jgi:hypothetical protein